MRTGGHRKLRKIATSKKILLIGQLALLMPGAARAVSPIASVVCHRALWRRPPQTTRPKPGARQTHDVRRGQTSARESFGATPRQLLPLFGGGCSLMQQCAKCEAEAKQAGENID